MSIDLHVVDSFRLVGPLGVTVEAWMNDAGASSVLSTLGLYGSVGVVAEKAQRLGDGTVPDQVARGGRALTPGGIITGLSSQEVVDWSLKLSGLFGGHMNDSLGTIMVTQGSHVLMATVQLDGAPKISPSRDYGWVRWELPLWAPDPYLYGPPEERHVALSGSGVGLEFDLFDAAGVLAFGGAVAADVALHNPGNAVAYPVYTVTGDLPSGFILTQSTGGLVEFAGPVRADAPAVVDMAGRVLVAGVDRSDEIARVEWAGVAPGGSLVPELSTSQGSGFAVAAVRPTWL